MRAAAAAARVTAVAAFLHALPARPAACEAAAPPPRAWADAVTAAAASAAAAAVDGVARAGAAAVDGTRAASTVAAGGVARTSAVAADASRAAAAAAEATAHASRAASAAAAAGVEATVHASRAAAAAGVEATVHASRAASAAASAGAAATGDAARAAAALAARVADFSRSQRVLNEAPGAALLAALASEGFARCAPPSAAWSKPLALALPLRVPLLAAGGAGGGADALFEEALVVIAAEESGAGALTGVLVEVRVPSRGFAWAARVPAAAWTTLAVPGLSLDAGGLASAGLLVATSLSREGGGGGGYTLSVDVLLGLHLKGVDLGSGSRVKLAGLGPFSIPRALAGR
jgi:hypothetical protein